MITVQLIGGHGNQLFQFAFGLAQAKRLGTRLQLNTSKLGGKRPFSLNQWVTPKIDVPYHVEPTVREHGMPYNQAVVNSIKNGDVIQGYWQSEKYLAGVEKELRALLPRVTDNATLENVQNPPTSVAVHVRRGDYLVEPHKSFHGNLTLRDYYWNAMQYITDRVESPKFYIFSDDPEWCRENFNFGNYEIVNPTEEASDIYSMSLCQHAIIANSSFGWWGAWLGERKKNRIVVAPKNWFQTQDEDARDVVPERWARI